MYETQEQWLREFNQNAAAQGFTFGRRSPFSEEEERASGGRGLAGYLRSIAGGASRAAVAAGRGAARAANETSDFLWGTGVALGRALGLVEEGDAASPMEQYRMDVESNPFRFNIREERDEGLYGVVESIAQFTTGFIGAGKVLAPLRLAARGAAAARAVGAAGKAARTAGRFTEATAAGFVADFTVFDPMEERLSDMIENGPDWLSNPLTQMLQTHEDDSQWEARLRAGAEGLVLGSVLESLIWGTRVIRAKRAVKAGTMTQEEASKVVEDALDAVEAAESKRGPFEITTDEDGFTTIRLTEEEAAKAGLSPEDTVFRTEDPLQAQAYLASIEDAINNAQLPIGKLTDEQRESFRESFRKLVQDFEKKGVGDDPLETFHINLNRMNTDDDVKAIIGSMGETLFEEYKAIRNRVVDGGPWTHEARAAAVNAAFEKYGMEGMGEILERSFESTGRLWFDVLSGRALLARQAAVVRAKAAALSMDGTNDVAAKAFADELDTLARVEGEVAGLLANVGRALDSARIPVDELGVMVKNPKVVEALTSEAPKKLTKRPTEGLNGRQLQALADMITLFDRPEDILEAMRRERKVAVKGVQQKPGFWRKLMGWRINALLSGPKTQIVNAVSTLGASFLEPLEMVWAGARTGNVALRRQGSDILWGNVMFTFDMLGGLAKALRNPGTAGARPMGADAVRQVWRSKVNILDPRNMVDDTGRSLDKVFENSPRLDWLVTLPGRLMMTTDEFMKQMYYRSNVRAAVLRRARELGITDPKEIEARVKAALEVSVRDDGAGIIPEFVERSRSITFSNDLGYGIGKWLQEGRNRYPLMEVIMPFVRTPVNVVRFAWKRTPFLARWQRQFQEDIKAGGERAALARARVEVGSLVYAGAAILAAGGYITGGGPRQSNLRRQWQQAGFQPYSVRIGDKQVSFLRLEPISTPLQIVADLVEMAGEMEQQDAMEAVWSTLAAISSSITSKTFLRGLSDFFDAVASGDEKAFRYFGESLVTSFQPNVMNQINNDPLYREARGIIEKIQSRTPGWSTDLEPRRNIFGEPVAKSPGSYLQNFNPFTTMGAPDETLAELYELGGEIRMPQGLLEYGQVNLRDRDLFDNGTGQSPYDRWLELVSKPIRGRSLREDLERRMKSAQWERLSAGTDLFPGGGRLKLVQRVIDQHYDRAFAQVLREYPKLAAAIKEARRGRISALSSSGSTLQRTFDLASQ